MTPWIDERPAERVPRSKHQHGQPPNAFVLWQDGPQFHLRGIVQINHIDVVMGIWTDGGLWQISGFHIPIVQQDSSIQRENTLRGGNQRVDVTLLQGTEKRITTCNSYNITARESRSLQE